MRCKYLVYSGNQEFEDMFPRFYKTIVLSQPGVKPSKEFEIVIIHLAEVAVFAP